MLPPMKFRKPERSVRLIHHQSREEIDYRCNPVVYRIKKRDYRFSSGKQGFVRNGLQMHLSALK